MRQWGLALIATLLTCLLIGGPAAATVSVNVPIGHWSYNAIDKLSSLGLVRSQMRGTKPYTRLEMARLLREARSQFEELSAAEKPQPHGRLEIIRALLERLEKEFGAEIDQLSSGVQPKGYLKPLEDFYLHFYYGDNDFDLENDKGQKLAKDANIRAGFSSHAVLFNHLAWYVNPEFRYSEGRFGGRDDRIDILEGYGKLQLFNVEVEAGRDSLWWGTGRHGSLLLSDNAQPLDLIKLSNPRPAVLPWIFKYLGLYKITLFWSELERSRAVPRTEFMGYRIHLKPLPFFDFAHSRTFMLGGQNSGVKGVGDLSLSDWLKVLAGSPRTGGDLDTNQIFSFDLDFLFQNVDRWVPILKTINFWLEYGDESGIAAMKNGMLLGIKFGDLFLTGRTDFICEVADTVAHGHPGLWYSHSRYRTGYRYRGNIMGHNMGGDARELYLRLEQYLSPYLVLGLDYNRQERGIEASVEEDRDRFDLDLAYQKSAGLRLHGGYRFEAIDNLNQAAGNDQDNNILWIFLDYSF